MARNPVKDRQRADPRREVFCIHYDDCLDDALRIGWEGFSCSGCNGCEPVPWDRERLLDDNFRCMALLLAVFRPGAVKNLSPNRMVEWLEAEASKLRDAV